MAVGQFYYIPTPGNNGVEARIYVSIFDDPANNRTGVVYYLEVRKANGFQSQDNTSGSISSNAGNSAGVGGNKTLPANGAWVEFARAPTTYFNHDADGKFRGTLYIYVSN